MEPSFRRFSGQESLAGIAFLPYLGRSPKQQVYCLIGQTIATTAVQYILPSFNMPWTDNSEVPKVKLEDSQKVLISGYAESYRDATSKERQGIIRKILGELMSKDSSSSRTDRKAHRRALKQVCHVDYLSENSDIFQGCGHIHGEPCPEACQKGPCQLHQELVPQPDHCLFQEGRVGGHLLGAE